MEFGDFERKTTGDEIVDVGYACERRQCWTGERGKGWEEALSGDEVEDVGEELRGWLI